MRTSVKGHVSPLLVAGGGLLLLGAAVAWKLSHRQEAYIRRLHPVVQGKFRAFIAAVERETGWKVEITSGYRTLAKQRSLMKSNGLAVPKSAHLFGFALDINLVKGRKRLTLSSSSQEWIDSGVVAIAKRFGMRWGGNFRKPDRVHFDILWAPKVADRWIALAKAQFGDKGWGDKGNQVRIG